MDMVMRPDDTDADLMARLCADNGAYAAPSAVIIAAHPDDEVIGAGGRLPRLKKAILIHVTDGAPRTMHDALKAGYKTREEYAEVRYAELTAALGLAGIHQRQCITIGVTDQEASLYLYELSHQLAGILCDIRPEIVMTHPYEGGHPDHDATAFAVYSACRLLEERGIAPPVLVEFTSYHAREDGHISAARFIPFDGRSDTTVVLTEHASLLKRRMLDCFKTQKAVLGTFPAGVERFRVAPAYDFTLPPHPGRLYYEYFSWGMVGNCWRALARRALEALALGECL